MKNPKKSIMLGNIFFVMYLFCCSCSFLNSSNQSILQIQEQTDWGIISVSIELKSESLSDKFQNERAWGTNGYGLALSPLDLKIKLGEKDVFVRMSCYSDLYNISDITLRKENAQIIITLKGGQQATAYIADIYIDKEGYLTKRRVFSPKFKKEVFEETNYSYIRRDDM